MDSRYVILMEPMHEAGEKLLADRPEFEVHIVRTYEDRALLARADAIVSRLNPFTADDLTVAARLKLVSKHGVGLNNLPLAELRRRGIPVAWVADANATAVAETVFAMMIGCAKNIIAVDRAVRDGDYAIRTRKPTRELKDKTILLIGLGRIGSRVARYCTTFGMRVLGWDPGLAPKDYDTLGIRRVDDWRAELEAVDYISFQVPLTPETAGMMGRAEIAALGSEAVVINCSRGGIIDEEALAEALAGGAIRGAGLDVTRDEPPHADNPLLAPETYGRLILSPHLAGLSPECAISMATIAAQNVIDFFFGTLQPKYRAQ